MRGALFGGRWIGSGWSGARTRLNWLGLRWPGRPAGLTRAELAMQLADDYSTGQSGPVPAAARRPLLHLVALWITLAAGLPELALGFWYYQAGYPLGRAVATGAIAGGCYLGYALLAAELGSRTGRTTALLARAVLGSAASVVVSAALIGFAAARVALASAVLAGVYHVLFGWGPVALIAAAAAVAGVAASLFGFTGITMFARYVAAPLMLLWVLYLVVRGIEATPYQLLIATPRASTVLPVPAGVSLAIATVAWGNEPDTWRYSRPGFGWPAAGYLAALAVGLVLFVVGGWVVASMSHAGAFDLGHAYRLGARYSVFGAAWLGAVLATVMQLGRSGGGYYQMTNGAQQLAEHLRLVQRGWRRWHSSLLLAALSAVVTWVVVTSGVPVSILARVAAWSAVVLPSVVVVICVDFVAVRRPAAGQADEDSGRYAAPGSAAEGGSGGSRPISWAGVISVLAGAAFGGFGLGLLPGQHSLPAIGFAPVAAWLLAGLLYAVIRMAQAAAAAVPGLVAAGTAPLRMLRRPWRRAASLPAGIRPAAARPRPGPTARDLLDAIRRDAAAEAGGNPFLALVTGGSAPRERLLGFAVQQTRLLGSDRRSFLHLASRAGDPASVFFAGLADAERHALDLLVVFAAALDGKAALGPAEPVPGCQAYPAYVAWLALNAPPADAVLALTADMAVWAGAFETMAQALREHPGYGLDEPACAFFDLIAALGEQVEAEALAIIQAHMDAGRPPVRAPVYARMLRTYGQMFWTSLAEDKIAPVPARRRRQAGKARQRS